MCPFHHPALVKLRANNNKNFYFTLKSKTIRMSSQTVYFTNPASISTLQNQVGTNTPALPALSTMTRLVNFLTGTSGIVCTTSNGQSANQTGAPTANTDLNGQAFKGLLCAAGNAFSGDQSIFTTGVKDAAGNPYDINSVFNQGSSTKLLAGIVEAKMIEEGYFLPTDTIVTYVPAFTGFGYAYIYATGAYSSSYVAPPNLTTYTGTLTRIALNTLTVAQAMSWQIVFPYEQSAFGSFRQGVFVSTAPQPQPDWGYLNACAQAEQIMPLGLSLGATGACQLYAPATASAVAGQFINGYQVYNVVPGTGALRNPIYDSFAGDASYCTGPLTDYLNTIINCIKSATIPLAFVPGSQVASQQNVNSAHASYSSLCPLLMQAVCVRALSLRQGTAGFPAAGTYPSLMSYIRTKILAPLGITNVNSSFAYMETGPTSGNNVELSWRRAYVYRLLWKQYISSILGKWYRSKSFGLC